MAFCIAGRYKVLGFLFGLCFLTTLCFAEEDNTELDEVAEETAGAQNLLQFGVMILCTTGRNPLDYNNYGCYCGKGGSGRAVDGVDRCCETHDRCYSNAIKNHGCASWYVYFATYRATACTRCSSRRSYGFFDFLAKCKIAVCECDSAAAKCFARNTYNRSYKGYDKKKNC